MKLAEFHEAKPVVDRLEAFQSCTEGLKDRKVAKISFLFGPDDHGEKRSLTITGPAAQVLMDNMDAIVRAEFASAKKELDKIGGAR